jgi:hypothetical protein
MTATSANPTDRGLTAPRSAAIAGVISGILFITSLSLAMLAFPGSRASTPAWIKDNARALFLALNMVPFAGIFFLWFLGVARDRLGSHEDKFFATIFLGSGLLYLAMTFAATAMAFGYIAVYTQDRSTLTSTTYGFSLAVIDYLTFVYSARMAAVFMISTATLWLRTGVMPRWVVLLTYLLALVLLFVINSTRWIILIFPIWLLIVSLIMLIGNVRRRPVEQAAQALEQATSVP